MSTRSKIYELNEWLDRDASLVYHNQPIAQDWARLSKVIEELGEAINVFIGLTGQNPRKGHYGTMGELNKEILDTAITAILCYQHFNPDDDVMFCLEEAIRVMHTRAGLSSEYCSIEGPHRATECNGGHESDEK